MNLNLTLILEIISFLILMALLSRLLYRPILGVMSKRQDEVNRGIDSANKAAEEARKNVLLSEKNLKDAQEQIMKLKRDTQLHAENLKMQIEQEARQEAGRLLKQAGEEINRQFNAAQEKLEQRIAEFSVAIAGKILSREIDAKDHQRLIEEGIKNILASERAD
ncbi:MAG: F0F1 ATP synthase subunit B [Candidatus Omnitrophica bacterium]|nr:F0F1 ATP synthase subunit B [Candidatus Omnitrophota bacterium]